MDHPERAYSSWRSIDGAYQEAGGEVQIEGLEVIPLSPNSRQILNVLVAGIAMQRQSKQEPGEEPGQDHVRMAWSKILRDE